MNAFRSQWTTMFESRANDPADASARIRVLRRALGRGEP